MGKRKVKIYYGLSGSLKGTTIENKESCSQVMRSEIKVWKNNRNLLFPWIVEETNINYALLHLTRLEDYKIGNLVVERGVTDMMFYELKKNPELITSSIIENAVKREIEILGGDDVEVKKILLIMSDQEFIANRVLQEKTRHEWFKSVDDYIENQNEYIDFTETYNDISEVIVINDAKDYITRKLGIDYYV